MELWHVIDNSQSKAEQDEIFRKTHKIKELFQSEKGQECLRDCLKGKYIISLYRQPSTRTRLKCKFAGEHLGARVEVLDEIAKTSMAKGESWEEVLWTFSEEGVDILTIRDPQNFLPQELAAMCDENGFREKIINCGDGNHLHPTQGLGDVFTIEEHYQGKFGQEPLKIAIGADMKARALHSLVMTLAKYPVELTLVSWQEPEFLMPSEYFQEFIKNNGEPIQTASLSSGEKYDVIYWIRYQVEHAPEERKEELQGNYNRDFGATPEFLNTFLKDDGIFLHPGPITKEIDRRIRFDSRVKYGEQIRNNRLVMMTLYLMMLNPNFRIPKPSEI